MIILIAAMTEDRVIGKNGDIPWRIPEDWKNFKKLTTGNVVIMGRRTFESIGKPLPNRQNIVVSATVKAIPGVDVCVSLTKALETAKLSGKQIFICGGAQLYEEALPLAEKLYISHVKKKVDGDTFFPHWGDNWKEESRQTFEDFDFVVYGRA